MMLPASGVVSIGSKRHAQAARVMQAARHDRPTCNLIPLLASIRAAAAAPCITLLFSGRLFGLAVNEFAII